MQGTVVRVRHADGRREREKKERQVIVRASDGLDFGFSLIRKVQAEAMRACGEKRMVELRACGRGEIGGQ